MKKKFLSFILAMCLILPCAFALSACGKNPESGGPVDLAGKTIVVQAGSCELDWDYNIPITSIEQGDNGAYATELTLEQFVEHFYTSNRQVIEALAHNSNINTVEEAKTSVENWAEGTILSKNPIIKFSEDGTTATTYAGSDINLETPLKEYTVQKSGTDEFFIYDLYEEQDAKIRITCDYDSIDVTSSTGAELCYSTTFDLSSYGEIKILLTDSYDYVKEFGLNECEFEYVARTLRLWSKNFVITYKVK